MGAEVVNIQDLFIGRKQGKITEIDKKVMLVE